MRDKLGAVRNQLEESRIRVVQLQTNLERAEEAGMRDVVTRIGNRRFFETAFAQEVEKARRTGEDFCVALADLDRFKLVNDRFGHLVGDRILRLFAEILVQNVRGQDKVARFGGEEFALMFPGTRVVDALNAVERIRCVLESKKWALESSGERVGKVTASFGIAKLQAERDRRRPSGEGRPAPIRSQGRGTQSHHGRPRGRRPPARAATRARQTRRDRLTPSRERSAMLRSSARPIRTRP